MADSISLAMVDALHASGAYAIKRQIDPPDGMTIDAGTPEFTAAMRKVGRAVTLS